MDIEKLNRHNFRSCLNAMARPGSLHQLIPFENSSIFAAAALLLYAEVSFFQNIQNDWEIIKAITNATEESVDKADYLFLSSPDKSILNDAQSGDQQNPEQSATLICSCPGFNEGAHVTIQGPGIDGCHEVILPATEDFLSSLMKKNKHFPLGVDLFFIGEDMQVCGIPRSTQVELL